MHRVFDPFSDPVTRKRDEDQQSDDFGCWTAATTSGGARAGGIPSVPVPVPARLILDVNGDQGDRVPGSKGQGDEPTDGANKEHMSKVFCHIHRLLEHDNAEWNSRNPAYEANDTKDAKDCKHNGSGIVVFDKVINSGADSKNNM